MNWMKLLCSPLQANFARIVTMKQSEGFWLIIRVAGLVVVSETDTCLVVFGNM